MRMRQKAKALWLHRKDSRIEPWTVESLLRTMRNELVTAGWKKGGRVGGEDCGNEGKEVARSGRYWSVIKYGRGFDEK